MEKAITIYQDKKLVALLLVNEIDFGYLDKKIVCYTKKEHKSLVEHVLSLFKGTQVNIRELIEKLNVGFKNDLKEDVKTITTAFELLSENTNKTIRNKRMLEREGLTKYVKVVAHVGIEKGKYIRKR